VNATEPAGQRSEREALTHDVPARGRARELHVFDAEQLLAHVHIGDAGLDPGDRRVRRRLARAVWRAPGADRDGARGHPAEHDLYGARRDVLALDPERPATLSHRIATELLRDELGFRGVLVSDDLGMKAVADRYSIEELAVLTIEAGVDHLLVREPVARQMAAFEAIVYAAEARSEIRARVAESAARVAALKAACTVPMPAPGAMLASLLGTPAHEALAGSFGPGPASAAAGSLAADS